MADLTWTLLTTYTSQAADVQPPWVVAPGDIPPSASHLKLIATGSWIPLLGIGECGPDGRAGQSIADDQLLLVDCPLGALIGRFGGSSATLKATEADAAAGATKPFAVGSYAVVKLPEKFVGPLFLGFNVLRRPLKLQSLKVEIYTGA